MNSTLLKPDGPAGKAPFRPITYAKPSVSREQRNDGSIILRADQPLGACDHSLANLFRRAVERQPDRVFIAERDDAGGWSGLTYAEAKRNLDAVAQALMDRSLSADRPVMIL